MKLLCINDKLIVSKGTGYICRHTGDGLKDGQTYTTNGKPFTDEYGQQCYYIDGLGSKLCCRFTELLDQSETYTYTSVKLAEPSLN